MSATVRAKFTCVGIHHIHTFSSAEVAEVKLVPVWGSGEGNRSWSEATPQGELRMTLTNPEALGAFELGKEYFLDFTPAG